MCNHVNWFVAITREVIDCPGLLNGLPAAFPPKVIHEL